MNAVLCFIRRSTDAQNQAFKPNCMLEVNESHHDVKNLYCIKISSLHVVNSFILCFIAMDLVGV